VWHGYPPGPPCRARPPGPPPRWWGAPLRPCLRGLPTGVLVYQQPSRPHRHHPPAGDPAAGRQAPAAGAWPVGRPPDPPPPAPPGTAPPPPSRPAARAAAAPACEADCESPRTGGCWPPRSTWPASPPSGCAQDRGGGPWLPTEPEETEPTGTNRRPDPFWCRRGAHDPPTATITYPAGRPLRTTLLGATGRSAPSFWGRPGRATACHALTAAAGPRQGARGPRRLPRARCALDGAGPTPPCAWRSPGHPWSRGHAGGAALGVAAAGWPRRSSRWRSCRRWRPAC